MNLIDAILSNADRRPGHPALEQNDRVVTYSALRDEVIDLAGRLREAGIDQGDLVGLGMGDTIGYFVAMLALFRLGAVLLPVDVRWTATEKANVLRAFGAATVLVDDPVDGLEEVRQIVPSDLPAASGQSAAPWPDAADLPLLLSLSSGTTGIPKGPRLTHAQFMMRLLCERGSLSLRDADVFRGRAGLWPGASSGWRDGHPMSAPLHSGAADHGHCNDRYDLDISCAHNPASACRRNGVAPGTLPGSPPADIERVGLASRRARASASACLRRLHQLVCLHRRRIDQRIDARC
jgi:acyl-coenzyme A synthetase/AMP-(fatty) acid ligase